MDTDYSSADSSDLTELSSSEVSSISSISMSSDSELFEEEEDRIVSQSDSSRSSFFGDSSQNSNEESIDGDDSSNSSHTPQRLVRSNSDRLDSTPESTIANSDNSQSSDRDRDLINRGRRSTRSSNSGHSSRSRSRLSSERSITQSPRGSSPRGRRSVTRSPNSEISVSNESDRSSLANRIIRGRRIRQSESASSTPENSERQSDTDRSRPQQSDPDSDTEIYNASDEMNSAISGDQIIQPAEADDDVILIPQVIETIDLCTQAPGDMQRLPARTRTYIDEVIVINDSPANTQTQRRITNNRQNRRSQAGPYPNDSLNDSQIQKVKIQCPICLEGAVGREPQSTSCGHIFCKQCLLLSLQQEKRCPVCKKALKTKRDYHNIYL